MGRKHCRKSRNCLLRVISPFPLVFSKVLCCRHVKTRSCLGKGQGKTMMNSKMRKKCVLHLPNKSVTLLPEHESFQKHCKKMRKCWQTAMVKFSLGFWEIYQKSYLSFFFNFNEDSIFRLKNYGFQTMI